MQRSEKFLLNAHRTHPYSKTSPKDHSLIKDSWRKPPPPHQENTGNRPEMGSRAIDLVSTFSNKIAISINDGEVTVGFGERLPQWQPLLFWNDLGKRSWSRKQLQRPLRPLRVRRTIDDRCQLLQLFRCSWLALFLKQQCCGLLSESWSVFQTTRATRAEFIFSHHAYNSNSIHPLPVFRKFRVLNARTKMYQFQNWREQKIGCAKVGKTKLSHGQNVASLRNAFRNRCALFAHSRLWPRAHNTASPVKCSDGSSLPPWPPICAAGANVVLFQSMFFKVGFCSPIPSPLKTEKVWDPRTSIIDISTGWNFSQICVNWDHMLTFYVPNSNELVANGHPDEARPLSDGQTTHLVFADKKSVWTCTCFRQWEKITNFIRVHSCKPTSDFLQWQYQPVCSNPLFMVTQRRFISLRVESPLTWSPFGFHNFSPMNHML